MKVNYANGIYFPSFFNMVIKTNEEVETAINNNYPTFIHEFIHYIQDIMLPYNIRFNMTNLSLFYDMRQYTINHGGINRPFDKWSENSKLIMKQLEYTWGSSVSYNIIEPIDYVQSEFYQMTLPNNESKIYKYTLALNGKLLSYHVGAMDMLEYIADKIVGKHYKINTPHLPYKTIDFIFEHYGLSHIPFDVRLCIVEFCLYNDNPIHTLFGSFLDNDFIKKNPNIFEDYNTCYKLLLHHAEWESVGNIKETIISKAERRLHDFKNELINHYNANFNEIVAWIEKVSHFVVNEFTDKFIFLNMFQMSENELTEFISRTLDYIGFPLVMNNKLKCSSFIHECVEKEQFIQFYVLQEFMQYISNTGKSCPIYKFCTANGSISDNKCLTNPNSKVFDDNSCPYILFLKSYGLMNIV